MKIKLTYRDKLLELAKIYNVKEVLEYIKRRKNLTSGQLELILRKNKIAVPKDYQSNFFRENIKKKISKYLKQIEISKDNKVRSLNKLSRRAGYLKNDSRQSIANFFNNLRKSIASLRKNSFNSIINFFSNFWKTSGAIGLAFLNILPLLWTTIYNFVGNVLTDLFNGIYNQKINASRANQAIIGFFVIVGIVTIIISGVTTFNNPKKLNENEIVKKIEPPKKKELNKQKKNSTPKIQVKKEAKKHNIKKKKVEKKKKENLWKT